MKPKISLLLVMLTLSLIGCTTVQPPSISNENSNMFFDMLSPKDEARNNFRCADVYFPYATRALEAPSWLVVPKKIQEEHLRKGASILYDLGYSESEVQGVLMTDFLHGDELPLIGYKGSAETVISKHQACQSLL